MQETADGCHSRRTLAGPGSGRYVERRSQFFAYATPIAAAPELAAWLAGLRRTHHDARHLPHAWVAADGAERHSDDGEPAGTGGRPCQAALAAGGLRAAAVAVARLYGGVPLGAANLGRAYGQAAKSAVSAAGVLEQRRFRRLHLRLPYPLVPLAERWLPTVAAADIRRTFGAEAGITAWIPEGALDDLPPALRPGHRVDEAVDWR